MNILNKLISHRGNLYGCDPKLENTHAYIENAIKSGFDVECDIWLQNGTLYLGHDAPEHQVDPHWLKNKPLWCHAKNPEALTWMLQNDIHCFWHEEDSYTITSRGIVWCYPGFEIQSGVMVLKTKDFNPYLQETRLSGLCSDDVYFIREELQRLHPQYWSRHGQVPRSR